MIHVTIYQNQKDEYIGFSARGHAGFAESGEDIVCAAVSVLMINTVNALELYADAKLSVSGEEEEGALDVRLTDQPTEKTELLFKTMALGLTQMEDDENYAEYIDLTFEEVQQP